MTFPASAPPRTPGRGTHTLLGLAGLLALAWLGAMIATSATWVSK